MPKRSYREPLAATGVAAALALAVLAGLPETLGAHPFWARQTGLVGVAGGVAIYAIARITGLSPRRLILVGAVALAVSWLSAYFGKSIFVASYAENALAGRAWYIGWFVVAGSATLLASALAGRVFGESVRHGRA